MGSISHDSDLSIIWYLSFISDSSTNYECYIVKRSRIHLIVVTSKPHNTKPKLRAGLGKTNRTSVSIVESRPLQQSRLGTRFEAPKICIFSIRSLGQPENYSICSSSPRDFVASHTTWNRLSHITDIRRTLGDGVQDSEHNLCRKEVTENAMKSALDRREKVVGYGTKEGAQYIDCPNSCLYLLHISYKREETCIQGSK